MVRGSDTTLNGLIERLAQGDESARSALLDHACDRLLCLTRKMFHSYPDLCRWETTDDVYQNAMLRLHRALSAVQPSSVKHFFNLAALQVRRELRDLAKHYRAGQGKLHHTDGQPADEKGGALHERADEPADLDQWAAFHAQVDALPEEEKEVFDLLFYEDLSQEEAATVLGISLRTLKRRWQSARCRLYEKLNEAAS